jgi:hypothetical protein
MQRKKLTMGAKSSFFFNAVVWSSLEQSRQGAVAHMPIMAPA